MHPTCLLCPFNCPPKRSAEKIIKASIHHLNLSNNLFKFAHKVLDGLTVLIDQHTNGNAGHEKSVQKILNAVFSLIVHIVGLLQFQDALCHRLDDIGMSVSNFYQSLTESAKRFIEMIFI